MNSIKYFLFILCIAFYLPMQANEGMWLPNLLKKLNEPEMKSLGMRISAEQIYSINQASLKDAVVHFGGFCTAEVISEQGLILTNHHCGYGQIQRHSTPENNYLEKGFWAKSHDEEIPSPGLSATFIARIENISDKVLAGVTSDMTVEERQSHIDKNLANIRTETTKDDFQNVVIRPFYEGNEYYLFVTTTYRDIRMVGTPPSFIGKYGADTDNWVWPRHTGDFALFRIYADKDNNPAEYAEDNLPYQPKYSMKISMQGVKEGDFVFAFGFPGRTDQYLHSAAIDQVQNVLNPVRVAIRERSLAIIDAAMRQDSIIKIQYASKQSGISNYWKKWKGEMMGLKRSNAIKERQKYEREFNRRVAQNADLFQYSNLTKSFEELYKKQNPYSRAVNIYSETLLRNPEITRQAANLQSLVQVFEESGQDAFDERKKRIQTSLTAFYKDYQPEIDEKVLAAMLEYYYLNQPPEYHPETLLEMSTTYQNRWDIAVSQLFKKTILINQEKLNDLLDGESATILEAIENDPLIQLVADFNNLVREKIYPNYNEITTQINALKRDYMKAQQLAFPERVYSPDANGTMRVSYGKVSGYSPRDAIYYEANTSLDGVMSKYVPGDYEFDLDDRFRKIFEEKDYGPYEVNGSVPVNFTAALHTTGGNSGSPVLNANGHLVGLLFDGSWEGVMSDIYYSEELVRSIMVDIRYVLFVIDKYANASHLFNEMNIIAAVETKSIPEQKMKSEPAKKKKKKKKKSKQIRE